LFPLWEGRAAIVSIAKEILKPLKNRGGARNQNDGAVIPATEKVEEVDASSEI
jgi:hypothetical protein